MRKWFKIVFSGFLIVVIVGAVVWRVDYERNVRPRIEASRGSLGKTTYPDYLNASFEEALQPLEEDLEASREEVEAKLLERQKLHVREQYALPTGDEIRLYDEFRYANYSYRVQDLEFYQVNTRDRGRAKQLGEEFLDAYLRWNTSYNSPDDNTLQMLERADAAVRAGSEDRTLLTFYALLNFLCKEHDRAWEVFRQVQGSDESPVAPVAAVLGKIWMLELAREMNKSNVDTTQLKVEAFAAMIDLMLLEKDQNQPERFWHMMANATNFFRSNDWEDFILALDEHDEISMYHRHYVAGRYYRLRAWEESRGGYVNTVSRAGWAGYEANATRAVEHLRRAWTLEPSIFHAPRILMDLASKGHDPDWTPRDWFYEATHARFDVEEVYRMYALCLTPRYGGSYQQLVQFAQECVDTDEWLTPVPSYSALAIQTIRTDLGEDYAQFVEANPAITELSARVTREVMERWKAQEPVYYPSNTKWLNVIGTLWLGERYEPIGEFFKFGGSWFQNDDFDWLGESVADIAIFAVLYNGGHAEVAQEHREIKDKIDNTTDPKILDEAKEWAKQSSELLEHEFLKFYMASYADRVDFRKKYLQGEKLELKFDGTLPWKFYTPYYGVDDKKIEMRVGTDDSRSVATFSRLFDLPYRVELTVDLPEGESHKGSPCRAGLIIGDLTSDQPWSDSFQEFGVTMDGHSYISLDFENFGWQDGLRGKRLKSPGFPAKMEFKVWEDWLEIRVNGELIMASKYTLPANPRQLNFGVGLVTQMEPYRFLIRDISIQHIQDSPYEHQLAAQLERYEASPEDPKVITALAEAQMRMENYDEASELIERALEIDPDAMQANYVKASIAVELEQFAKVVEIYSDLAERFPDNVKWKTNLVWAMTVCEDPEGYDPERALQVALAACEQDGYQQNYVLGSLAMAYAELGEFDKALELTRQALNASSKDTEAAFYRERFAGYSAGKTLSEQEED